MTNKTTITVGQRHSRSRIIHEAAREAIGAGLRVHIVSPDYSGPYPIDTTGEEVDPTDDHQQCDGCHEYVAPEHMHAGTLKGEPARYCHACWEPEGRWPDGGCGERAA